MAVYLSTLKQFFFFWKLARCKVYPPIYSFVRRGISSTAITNVFLDNKQERDHLCAFDLGANYHKFNTLEKGYSDLFLHVFIKIWEINFYKRFVVVNKWCSHSDRGSKKEWSKSWVIWKPRVSSFLLIYIYVTQVLTINY